MQQLRSLHALDPTHCPTSYRLAGIKQLLGQLREAVMEYTAVLELDCHYVPALKGKPAVCIQVSIY